MANEFKAAADVIAELAEIARSTDKIVGSMTSAEQETRTASAKVEKTAERFERLAEDVRNIGQSTNEAARGVLSAIELHARTNQDLHRDLSQLRNEVINVRQEILATASQMQAALNTVETRTRDHQKQMAESVKQMVLAMVGGAAVVLIAFLFYIRK